MAGNLNQKKLVEQLTNSVVNVLRAQEQSVVSGMLELKADMTDRIFLNGQDNSGSEIGQYSTKPMYASLNQTSQVRASSLKGRGKNDKEETFLNGKNRKSMYLPGGYSEFRKVVGRQNSKVDLMLTGSLKGDIRIGTRESTDNGGAIELAFTTDKQKEIAEGNEKRFGKTIFAASEIELDKLTLNWQNDIEEAFFNSFK